MVPNTVLVELNVLAHKLACVLVHGRAAPNVPHVHVRSTSAFGIDSEDPSPAGEARMVSKGR